MLQAVASIQLDQAGQRLEQGGLAGAVAADQADTIPIRYRGGKRREQRCGPRRTDALRNDRKGDGMIWQSVQFRARIVSAPGLVSACVAPGNGACRAAPEGQ